MSFTQRKYSRHCVVLTALLMLCSSVSAQVTSTWTNAASNVWLTPGNWDAGVPATNGIARFFNTMPSGGGNSAAGINLGGATNNGTNNQAVGAIFLESAPGGGTLTIGNSSSTNSGVLTLNGATVNGQANAILVTNSFQRPLTISNSAAGGTQSMSLALGNTTNFVVTPAGVSGQQGLSITLNVPVSEVNAGSSITVLGNGGSGAYGGKLILNNTIANSFTGGMTVGNSNGTSFGVLELKTIQALPATTQGVTPTVTVNPNSKLILTDVNGTFGAGVRVTLNGDGPNLSAGFQGALHTNGTAAYTVGFTAPVTLASDSTIQVAGSGNTLTLAGGLTGPGGLDLIGAGTLFLAGGSDYAGNTVLSSPSKLLVAGALAPAASSTITVNAGATLITLPGSIVSRPVNSGGTIGQSGQDGGTFVAQVTAGGNIHGGDNGTTFNGGLTTSFVNIASGVLNVNSMWQISGAAASSVVAGATVNANDNVQLGVTNQAVLSVRGTVNIAAGKTMTVQGVSAGTKSGLRGTETGVVNGAIIFGNADVRGDALGFTINGPITSSGTTDPLIPTRFGNITHNGDMTVQPGRFVQLTDTILGTGSFIAGPGGGYQALANTGPGRSYVFNNATFSGRTSGSSYFNTIDGDVTFNDGVYSPLAGVYTFNGKHTHDGNVAMSGKLIFNNDVEVRGTSTIGSADLSGSGNITIKPTGTLVRTTSISVFNMGLDVEGTLRSNQTWNVPVIIRGGTLDSNGGTMNLAGALTVEPGAGNSIIIEGGHVAVTGQTRVMSGGTLVNRGRMSGTGMLQVDAGAIIIEGGLPSDNSLNEKGIIIEGGLGGHGRVTGSVLVRGFVRPGTSPGILTLTGGFALEGQYQWELIANSVTNPGTNFDLIRTQLGGTSIAAGATVQVQFGNGIDLSNPFWANNQTWTIIDGDLGAPAISGVLPIVTGDYHFAFSTEINGPDLLLHWNATAVPEPTTYVLLGLSLSGAGLFGYRRWKKRTASWEQEVQPIEMEV